MNDACICLTDYEEADVYEAKVMMARKPQVCVECQRVIPTGARHEYVRGMWENRWYTYRTCMLCYKVRNDWFSCGWMFGYVWENLHDHMMDKCECESECDCDGFWGPPTHPIKVK